MPDRHVVRLTFVDRLNKAPRITLDKENTEYRWFSIEEMKKLKEGLDKFVRELLKKELIK
jgi:coenzyme F420-reducing hydrogenase delta subunit